MASTADDRGAVARDGAFFSHQLITRSMSSVAKSIELLAEGDTLEAATEAAVAEASKTIDNIKNVYVDDYRALVEDGRIQSYRVHTKITFVVHDETVE